jgi:hypothetical protein
MADVASKQQTAALFLSTIITRTRRHTELTKKKKLSTNYTANDRGSTPGRYMDFAFRHRVQTGSEVLYAS